MAVAVVIILVLIVIGLIIYNLNIHKKIQAFNNINQRINNLSIVQDFMNTIGEYSTVDEKIKKINDILIEVFKYHRNAEGERYIDNVQSFIKDYKEFICLMDNGELIKPDYVDRTFSKILKTIFFVAA